jgi:TatD DNase family protein
MPDFRCDMKYIDLHTHSLNTIPGVLAIHSFRAEDYSIPIEFPFSIGVHPWYIDHYKSQLSVVDNVAGSIKNCVAIGEAGLDKSRGASMEVQIQVFEQQVLLAERHKKPMIIHCVRATDLLLGIKKRVNPQMPWILHGFRGKLPQAVQLVQHGFYLSLGVNWLNRPDDFKELLFMLKGENLFFETDDAEQEKIADLYATASVLYPDIEQTIVNTALNVFDNSLENWDK